MEERERGYWATPSLYFFLFCLEVTTLCIEWVYILWENWGCVVWIIYWVGRQSSYRISPNNNLKLRQYWQNTVLNGSSSYSKQTSHFVSSFLLCVTLICEWVTSTLLVPIVPFLQILVSRLFVFHSLHNCHFAPLSKAQWHPQPILDNPTWHSYLSAGAHSLPACLPG